MELHEKLLICPECDKNQFNRNNKDKLICSNCNREYLIEGNITKMYLPNNWKHSKHDVTEIVNQFYEKTPFPNYEEMEGINDLVIKSELSYYAKFLNEQIPFNVNVLEVGCGTGQLANFLGLASRNVFGTDMCLKFIEISRKF